MDKYYTSQEIADLLKVSDATIRRKLEDKIIPGHKIGSQWRVSQSQLNQYLEETQNRDVNNELVVS